MYCPDCDATDIHFDVPEAKGLKYWFDCRCEKCDCTFKIEYEDEI
jgi:hypothetical protein